MNGQMTVKGYSLHVIATAVGKWVSERSGQSHSATVLAYGADILFEALVKLVLLSIGSIMLGTTGIVAVVVFTASSFRLLTGGAHCTVYYRCLVSSLLIFLGLGSILQMTSPILLGWSEQVLLVPLVLSLYWIFRWAPVPPENKPLRNEKDRLARKRWAVALCLVVTAALYIAGTSRWWVWAVALGLSWQSFTLTPAGHTLLKGLDTLLTYPFLEGGEMKHEATDGSPR
ncbi:hypothetical protein SY88_18575 [Clostridiales bacterium PH28_bin88]|nr:hypothetical protein SY88_18575 [Clostridiales bacterium PH28_bin88]